MRRPIFMLFDKIRLEKQNAGKERIFFCSTNDLVVQFCYVAKKNNFELDGVMPLQIPNNAITDYSGVPIVPDLPSYQKKNCMIVLALSLPKSNIEEVTTILKNSGYDSILKLTNDDITAITTDIQQYSYFLDHLDEMLRTGNWDKSIFLRGLNQFTMMMALTLKMKGYVVNGIILEDNQAQMQNFNFKEIPFITAKVAAEQKSGIVIDTIPPNANADYPALAKRHTFWQPKLADLLAIQIHWGFLAQFYNLLNLDTPSQNLDYENRAKAILSAYDKVTICFMDSERIGNMMETLVFVNQREDRKKLYALITRYNQYDKGSIFGSEQTANNFLLKKIKEVCPVIAGDQVGFWKYFAQHHSNVVTYSDDFNHYNMRMKQIEKWHKDIYYVEDSPIIFSEEEEAYGRQKMRDMGITGKYVTFFNRGHKYLKTIFGTLGGKDVEKLPGCITRNSAVKDFSLMCQNLYKRGLQSVRMGYLVDDEIQGDGIIDYANNYREEFLDYYLIAKSKFFVCGFSGMQIIALLLHVPLVVVNLTQFTLDGDVSTHKDSKNKVMMLPKKLFDTNNNKFVSILEQLNLETNIPNRYDLLDYIGSHGLKYIDNTPEEIWDAAEEMLLRLEGRFNPTKEEIELQEKFQEALRQATKHSPTIIPCGDYVSHKFLLKNKWLVEPTRGGGAVSHTIFPNQRLKDFAARWS